MLPAWSRHVNHPSYRSKRRLGAVVAACLREPLLSRRVASSTAGNGINPVIAVLLGWAVRDEAVNPLTAAAAASIVAAVAIVVRREAMGPNL